ncbi:hypothetical protein DM860_014811 [Cuscuta australis]|uniref:Uncharacterized protein n=1 Tax=Cuscuta australis TaxID=267555 RepID=A0A328CZS3_9ASTE|nr:hypothetical protein DM860_014811 [Cuscuta australis]
MSQLISSMASLEEKLHQSDERRAELDIELVEAVSHQENSVLGQFSRKNQSHGGLDLAGSDGVDITQMHDPDQNDELGPNPDFMGTQPLVEVLQANFAPTSDAPLA